MDLNKTLSLAIPTYNRSELLDCCLSEHIEIVKKYNIKIYISDNCSTDNTLNVISKWQKIYPHIEYHINKENIGPDANFEQVLKYSDTKYTWLLGDTYQLPFDGIEYIINNCQDKNYDILVFNINRKSTLNSSLYTNPNLVLSDLGGMMSCLSSLVFSKKLIDQSNFKKYYNTHYIQTGIIFDFISKNNFTLKWFNNYLISNLNTNYKKKSWNDGKRVLEIGGKGWQDFVSSLPNVYSQESKDKAINDFSSLSGIFKFKHFLKLRKKGVLNNEQFTIYKEYIYRGFNLHPLFIYFILKAPIIILIITKVLLQILLPIFNIKKYIKKIWRKK